MTYTINGKQYTEFDINKLCAELLGIYVAKEQYMHFGDRDENVVIVGQEGYEFHHVVNYCSVWNDAGPIIDKCWNELMAIQDEFYCLTKWESIISIYNCTKLIAACICLIEMKEGT
jgi:hypothetical protein